MHASIKKTDEISTLGEQMKDFLNTQITSKFHIELLCKHISRSESQTIRLFKRIFGITPYTYVLGQKIGFAKIHVFRYSVRPGTKAAEMSGQVPENKKTDRADKLQRLSESMQLRHNKSLENRVIPVLFEREKGDGYHAGHAPDGTVIKIPEKNKKTPHVLTASGKRGELRKEPGAKGGNPKPLTLIITMQNPIQKRKE